MRTNAYIHALTWTLGVGELCSFFGYYAMPSMLTISVFMLAKILLLCRNLCSIKLIIHCQSAKKPTTSCHMTHIMACACTGFYSCDVIKRHNHQAWFCYVVPVDNNNIAAVERVFSSLKSSEQTRSLDDYIEVSLMLQHNSRTSL